MLRPLERDPSVSRVHDRVGKRLQCGVPTETQKTCKHHECKVSDAELVNAGSTAGRSAGMEITWVNLRSNNVEDGLLVVDEDCASGILNVHQLPAPKKNCPYKWKSPRGKLWDFLSLLAMLHKVKPECSVNRQGLHRLLAQTKNRRANRTTWIAVRWILAETVTSCSVSYHAPFQS